MFTKIKFLFTLTGCVAVLTALCPLVDAQTIEFNSTGTGFTTIPDVTGADLANGITPTFVHDPGTEVIANGALPDLTDGSIGTAAFGVNTGNGPGTALYRIDLGSPQFIDSVNTYTSTNGNDGNVRVNQDFELFASLNPLAPGNDSTDPLWTSIATVSAINPGGAIDFGGSSINLNNAQYQVFLWAAVPVSGAGGGESSIFKEFDIIEGSAVPEPTSAALLFGLGTIGLMSRRRKV